MRKVEENVWTFLERAGDLCGQMARADFEQEMHLNVVDGGLESPIEDLFWIACHVLARSEGLMVNPARDEIGNRAVLNVLTQQRIDAYRIDFLLSSEGIGPENYYAPVVVELDGHAFHDRDQRQRSYEKARDRFLVKKGFRVLHFTGSDVVADPFKCAFEALDMVGGFVGSGRDSYDPANPIGIE